MNSNGFNLQKTAPISALSALSALAVVTLVFEVEDEDEPCPHATAVFNSEDLSRLIFEMVYTPSWINQKPERFDRFWLWVLESKSFISVTCTSIHGSYRVEVRGKVERVYHGAHGRRLNLVTRSPGGRSIHHLPISDIDNVKPLQ